MRKEWLTKNVKHLRNLIQSPGKHRRSCISSAPPHHGIHGSEVVLKIEKQENLFNQLGSSLPCLSFSRAAFVDGTSGHERAGKAEKNERKRENAHDACWWCPMP